MLTFAAGIFWLVSLVRMLAFGFEPSASAVVIALVICTLDAFRRAFEATE